MNDHGRVRQLRLPLTTAQLQPLDGRCEIVQFCDTFEEQDLVRVNQLIMNVPKVTLRIYGYPNYRDLDFLGAVPNARRFIIELYNLEDISALSDFAPAVESLGLGATKRRFSLRVLESFSRLTDLWLNGHSKDFDVIGSLRTLKRLSLRSIKVPTLKGLVYLNSLEELELKLGSAPDLRDLPSIGRLKYFEAWLVRRMCDLTPIADLMGLRYLFLQTLKDVTALPSFCKLQDLRRVHLDKMKGLRDLTPVAAAPRLEELVVLDMPQLVEDAFRPFIGHQALRAASIGLGSFRRTRAAKSLLGLPEVRFPSPELRFIDIRAT